jgi:hypothetical protein
MKGTFRGTQYPALTTMGGVGGDQFALAVAAHGATRTANIRTLFIGR